MARLLRKGHLEEMAKTVFSFGAPAIRILDLDLNVAKKYQKDLQELGYVSSLEGPSVEHDPLKENKRYSVIVSPGRN